MMATTHALFGVALAVGAAFYAPEFAPVAAAAAFAGGLFPDLDLYVGHRKTLHFPVYYSLAAAPALALAALAPTALTVGLALFVLGAAAHSAMDVLGGGLELKPWLGRSDRAVYDHYRGRWLSPRRLIRYDGAPEDLLLALALGAFALGFVDATMQLVVAAAMTVSTVYAAFRKPMVRITEWLVPRLPAGVAAYVPERFVADLG